MKKLSEPRYPRFKDLQDYVWATLAVILAIFALTGCGEHGFEEWLFGESSSSEEANSISSSSNGSNDVQGVVGPLLQTKWGQGDPYNSELPFKEDGTRSITGCGTIAIAQIMKYHRHPVRGTGQSQPYPVRTGTQPSVNFNVAYDWDNMLNTYNSSATEQQRKAVGTLAYHVGVSNKRDFVKFGNGPEGSMSKDVALTTYFGYDRSIQILDRKFYEDAEWEGIIKRQLDSRLPVYYMGYVTGGGNHAFILDGYDNAGKFHVNWGWVGSQDGWFSLNALNTTKGDWNNGNLMIINIKPDIGGAPAPYEMALNSFTASKASVPQNELLTVSAQIRNNSSFEAFPGGQYGAALVNSSGNIVAVIGSTNAVTRAPNTSSSLFTLSGLVPGTVAPGQYKLRMVVKPTDGEWKIVERSAIREGVPNAINLTVTAGEANGGGYGMAINSFAASKTSVPQNELFTVSAQMKNVSMNEFPASNLGAALVNSSGSIVKIIGATTLVARSPGTTSGVATINGYVPETVTPGSYKLRIVVKPASSEEWKIATMSMPDIPNAINFTVTTGEANGGGYGLSLEEFKPEKTSVPQNGTFNVALKTRNVGLDAFGGGQLGVALVNNSGNIVEVVKTATWNSLNPNATRTGTLNNCTVSAAVPPGQYKLRIVIKPTGEEWRVATMSMPDVPNSIAFTVENAP